MAGKKRKQEGAGIWIAIAVLFAIGLWPIALGLLLYKLFGEDGKRRRELPAFIFLHKKPEYVEIKTRQNLQKSWDRHRIWQNLTYIPQYGIKKLDQKSYGPY